MKRRLRSGCAWLIATAVVVWPTLATAQDSLTTARNLYAAAAYEDALAALNRLGAAGPRPEESRTIEQYRAFCLLALGRGEEAAHAIEAVVAADPLYRPSEGDVSPRLRNAFSDVRRRMLPTVVQQRYTQAKAAFDRKEYAAASEGFGQVLELFADPDLTPAASRPPLSDMRTLTAGFRDLALQAATPPRAPEPPPPAPAPPVTTAAAAKPPAPALPKIYDASDSRVAPPMTIRQQLPPFPGALVRSMVGMIEVTIDEGGSVVAAVMRTPVNATYDRLAVGAAATWRYTPATLDGVPVKYRKLIQINLAPGR